MADVFKLPGDDEDYIKISYTETGSTFVDKVAAAKEFYRARREILDLPGTNWLEVLMVHWICSEIGHDVCIRSAAGYLAQQSSDWTHEDG